MSDIKRIETGPRMSQAVIHNGTVYLAGQVGKPGDSVTAQTTEVLAQIDRLLAECGSDKTRILSAQVWLADMADFAQMNAVWDGWTTVTCPRPSTARSAWHQALTASCSTSAQCKPRPAQAKAAASVAPEVKTISAPSAPKAAAIWLRARSIRLLAARPSA